MHAEDFNELFQNCMPIFIALGDEVRLTIIKVLANAGLYDDLGNDVSNTKDDLSIRPRQGMNVKEITEMTRLSRPAISHHLKILKKAGLVNVRQEGTANYYYLTIGDSTKKLCSLGLYLQELMNQVS
ncbi:DNA-binding transcriptional regulator, ArsR family [Lacrimispora sphenoides]|jgi:DNA-binding transcriptional ArsR family regulator|uniref:DNA-binding transcriptional regulator, ArsR family n=1 Tax=Lacrimispora sphenoides JCM 1415 TaxID=1297793 RepID=A0ABY1CGP1_9FIRM|nr:metalloregulator ArsR/SmtB family transcription factor [Lacrimispora sphenoides]EXG84386.1 putative transcriptional regulator [Clostridium sp. ASBs410]SET73662.1 DNA-binding transcriptional regulator, ArsR family [Lacrimispora sphenoides]SEU02913.1 DNA-binding transcriptional regulator, ArsR family [[Clostridium] sphenoides JCM 1415]SUY48728.1 ArsR family transcriptional regulator [Lacrimispora sphenoides]